MKVGTAIVFQNPDKHRSDLEVYNNELTYAREAEGLGFQSIWSVEHHFTDYTMCPNVVQYLSYLAGCTKEIQLGTAVIVLPWHNPMRVAEEVSVLDNMSGGRVLLGIGRGLGRTEFGGFNVDMNTSRERFIESAQMILEGLEQGYCEFDGAYIKQPKREIRPAPFKSFKGRAYAAAVSPESVDIMARLGVGILIVPQKPWAELIPELEAYRVKYTEHNPGEEPPSTMHFGWVYCHEDEEAAHDGAVKHIGEYYDSVLKHYELTASHLKNTKGYEYYAKMQDKVQEYGSDEAIKAFLSLQIWGTPETCYERIKEISRNIYSEHFSGVFSYGTLSWDDARRNRDLFVKKVMPELKKLPPLSERLKEAKKPSPALGASAASYPI